MKINVSIHIRSVEYPFRFERNKASLHYNVCILHIGIGKQHVPLTTLYVCYTTIILSLCYLSDKLFCVSNKCLSQMYSCNMTSIMSYIATHCVSIKYTLELMSNCCNYYYATFQLRNDTTVH